MAQTLINISLKSFENYLTVFYLSYINFSKKLPSTKHSKNETIDKSYSNELWTPRWLKTSVCASGVQAFQPETHF